MFNPLIPIHVATGVIGSFLPIYIFLESLKHIDKINIKKVRQNALISFIFILISWVVAGIYYVQVYGPIVRGPILDNKPIVHFVFMESKEHLFLIIPFLSLLVLLLSWFKLTDEYKKILRTSVLFLVILTIYMCVAGYIITQARISSGVV